MRRRWRIAGNVKKRMERANKIGARAAVIIGSDELGQGVVQVKDLVGGGQEAVSLDRLVERLQ